MLLELTDFARITRRQFVQWSLFLGHGIMAHIPWPIKSLELHYAMIQLLIKDIMNFHAPMTPYTKASI